MTAQLAVVLRTPHVGAKLRPIQGLIVDLDLDPDDRHPKAYFKTVKSGAKKKRGSSTFRALSRLGAEPSDLDLRLRATAPAPLIPRLGMDIVSPTHLLRPGLAGSVSV